MPAFWRKLLDFKLLLAAAGAPLILAALLVWTLVRPYTAGWRVTIPLLPLHVASAQQLEAAFDRYGYNWPPQGSVPPLVIQRFPEDMMSLDAGHKKSLFFRALLPMVEAENKRIRVQRRFLEQQFSKRRLLPGTRRWSQVERLAEMYRVEGDLNAAKVRSTLLRRVDEVPPALVLAQAANESAWGNSRFAREANNLFGQWTYREDLGIVPAQRDEGARHFVRVFPDLRSSVRAYLHNINISFAYVDLRRMRARMRAAGQPLDPYRLSSGLLRYSQRGPEYVDEIRTMISVNGLDNLGSLVLASLDE